MHAIITTLNRMAKGDLSQSCSYNKHNEFGDIAVHLNQALSNQHQLVTSIIDNNHQISASSTQNGQLGILLSKQAIEQTDLCTSITQAMQEMDISVRGSVRVRKAQLTQCDKSVATLFIALMFHNRRTSKAET